MKSKSKVVVLLLLILCTLTQGVFGDVIIQKDAISPGGLGLITIGGLLLIAAVIVIIWIVCVNIIKALRNKNVGK
jgi:hypothetical protein